MATALALAPGDVSEPAPPSRRRVNSAWGQPAAQALAGLNPQNGRRLAILLEDGQPLAKLEAKGLFKVIAEHGDIAMNFVWRHKGALAISAVLAAFVNDPQPFLTGGRDLAQVVGQAVVEPVIEPASEASRHVNWTFVLLACVGVFGLGAFRSLRRKRQSLNSHDANPRIVEPNPRAPPRE